MTRQGYRLLALVALLLALLWVFGLLAAGPAGLPEVPAVTRLGLPVVRFLADVAAVLTLGCVVMGAFVLPSRVVLTWARWCAVGWAAVLVLQLVLTVSDVTATSVAAALRPDVLATFAGGVGVGQVLVLELLGAVFVAVAAPWAVGTAGAWTVTVIAAATVAAPALLGHGGIASGHVAATVSLAVHLVAVALWAGGLLVLLAVVGHHPEAALRAVPRFSALALGCALVVGESGLLNASLRLAVPSQLVTTSYGALVLVKATVFAALVLLGWRQRSRVLPLIVAGNRRGGALLARVAGWELLLMGGAVAVSVVMARLGPPVLPPTGPGMTPVAVACLALAIPVLLVAAGAGARAVPRLRRYPEVLAVVFLVVVAEVGVVGVLPALLGAELGALLGALLLVASGWAFVTAVWRGAPWATGIVMVGWAFVAVGGHLLGAWTPRESGLGLVLAETLLAGLLLLPRRRSVRAEQRQPAMAG